MKLSNVTPSATSISCILKQLTESKQVISTEITVELLQEEPSDMRMRRKSNEVMKKSALLVTKKPNQKRDLDTWKC